MNISAVSEKWWSDECFYEPLIQVCRDFIWTRFSMKRVTDVNSQHVAEGNENTELYRYIHNWNTLLHMAETSNLVRGVSAVCGDEPHETTEQQNSRQAALLDCWDFPQCHG